MANVITVYVGKAGMTNLRVGLQQGIWGFKSNQPDYQRIAPGDLLLLGSGFSGGSPRVNLAAWRTGSLGSVELGRVTGPMYHDTAQVWPDESSPDVSYPHRFRFEHLGRIDDVDLGPDGPLGEQVADGLRRSAIAQGRAYVYEEPVGFALDPSDASRPTQPSPLRAAATAAGAAQGSGDEHGDSAETEPASVAEVVDAFEHELARAGLHLPADQHLPLRFLCGLMAKPFVIFTGLSGSGKTQLAVALGQWLGPQRRRVSPVRPDWTGAESLFGYENLLLPPSPDGRAAWSVPEELRFILRAADDPNEPYLLILDEMNLAHVERYFADVLSGMESGAEVLANLAEDDDGIWRIAPDGPDRLRFPHNLMVVGTVNIDETTYQFSPKVLDRSTSIEFQVGTDALVAERPDLARIEPASHALRRTILTAGRLVDVSTVPAEVRKRIEDLHGLLAEHGREFGHRSYQEMLRFAALCLDARPGISDASVLDFLVMQKVLPRVHGSSRELAGLMSGLEDFATGGDDGEDLPLSADKVNRMTRELEATHFTAF